MVQLRPVYGPLVAGLVFIAGCATETKAPQSGAPASAPKQAAPPAVRYNLAGYSTAFKQGYADACASPRRRNDPRFKSDTDYQMGWRDGTSMCRR